MSRGSEKLCSDLTCGKATSVTPDPCGRPARHHRKMLLKRNKRCIGFKLKLKIYPRRGMHTTLHYITKVLLAMAIFANNIKILQIKIFNLYYY